MNILLSLIIALMFGVTVYIYSEYRDNTREIILLQKEVYALDQQLNSVIEVLYKEEF